MTSLADQILQILYTRRGEFVAGSELLAAAGRATGLEQALAQIRATGQAVDSSPAHGLRLSQPIMLNSALLERELGTARIGRNVICFPQVGSTNDVAFDSARQAGADGLVVLAESQRAGRGRLGRKWVSPAASNVLMSVLLLEEQELLAHDCLTIAAGVAVAEGIEDFAGCRCQLKWPNDVLLEGAKLAGILVEVRRHGGRGAIVIGIGINANASPPAELLRRPATCLAEATSAYIDRIALVRGVLRRLDEWTRRVQQQDLENLHSCWLSRCGMINERITVSSKGRNYEGRVLDIDPLRGLALGLDSGQRIHLSADGCTVL